MAVDIQTIDAEVRVFPYTGLTAIQRQQSGIARAQVSLVWNQTTISSTSSGTLRALRLRGYLPRNFAYIVQDGSLKLGRTADAVVKDQGRGVYFENEWQCAISGTQNQDSFKMINEGSTKLELDLNRSSSPAFVQPSSTSASATLHHSTPGVFNAAQDLYQKIYKGNNYPKVIFRAEEEDILVTADNVCLTVDPYPQSAADSSVVVGELHFLQYDMDQAYNYLIHSPIPVR